MVVKRTAAKPARPAQETSAASKEPAPAAKKRSAGKTAPTTSAAKAPTKKAPGKKTAAQRSTTARKTAAGKTAQKKTAAKKTAAPRRASAGRRPSGGAGRTAPSSRRAAAEAAGIVAPGVLAVRPGEEPWTPQEIEDARAELRAEIRRLRTEITASEEAVTGLMRDSGDGAGDDQADVGTKNISREHEMSLADNAREMLMQTEHAVERLDNGTYGLCESCGNPIGKARMQAFPRATLCVDCKQRSERH